jgi:hypothetical protein
MRKFNAAGGGGIARHGVCRLGRSLPGLIGLPGELQARENEPYLHQQVLGNLHHMRDGSKPY